MNRKAIIGLFYQALGFLGCILILCTVAPLHWEYNNVRGILGSLLSTQLMFPFVICIIFFFIGLNTFLNSSVEEDKDK